MAETLRAEGKRRVRTLGWQVGLLLIVLLTFALRVREVRRARLWGDEYIMLEIGSAPNVRSVIERIEHENNTPLYPLIVHAAEKSAGNPPYFLRILSMLLGDVAAIFTIALAYRRWGPAAAMISGLILGTSPIASHFSAEIRPYALLGLLVVIRIALLQPVDRPPGYGRLIAEFAVLVLALASHPYGILLLPLGPLVMIHRRDTTSALRESAVSIAATLVSIPFLFAPYLRLPREANEYLEDVWRGHTLAAPAWTAIQDLLPSSSWPAEVLEPGSSLIDNPIRALATFLLLIIVLAGWRHLRRECDSESILLILALALATASYALGKPVAIPGRFSVGLVAPFSLLIAGTLKASRGTRLAAGAFIVISLFNVFLTWRSPDPPYDRPEDLAARALRKQCPGSAFVITVGLSGLPLRYHLRDRQDILFRAFPSSVANHIGWWAPRSLLDHPEVLHREAVAAAAEAYVESHRGLRVFIEGSDHPVAHLLRIELLKYFHPRPVLRFARGLFELEPRSR